MNTRSFVPSTVIALVWCLVAALGACNSGTGDCPQKQSIQPGAPCSDDNLQCAYDLDTPSPACDGTTTTIASSCTCTKGTWSCPSAVDCGGDGSVGNDGSANDGGPDGAEGSTDDGGAGD
jgi:hypothetical protein